MNQGGRGHWTVKYTGTQSAIKTLASKLLVQQGVCNTFNIQKG